jgi:hypothetical protein
MTQPCRTYRTIKQNRPYRLSGKLGAHSIDIIEALQYLERFRRRRLIKSSFDPIEPLAWSV